MKYEKSLRSLNKPKQNPSQRSMYTENINDISMEIEKPNQNNTFKIPNSVNMNNGINKGIIKKNFKSLNANFKKKKKNKSNRKRDEENILSKDIDVEEEMKELERMTENKGFKPRDLTNINISKNFIKNIKFKPMKYKGNFLPYHLRWIFHNTVKSNEIVLIQEIEALENEILRLKQMKMMNREFRKTANLPFGVSSNPCPCCKKVEKRKHECTHDFCEANCSKKRTETNAALAEMLPPNLSYLLNQNNPLKKKIFHGGKPIIFGLKTKEEDNITQSTINGNENNEKDHILGMSGGNTIFNTVQSNSGKNLIFNSTPIGLFTNNHHPITSNLFKSIQINPLDHTKCSSSNTNTGEKNINIDKNIVSNEKNNSADKKFFFTVKK